MKYLTENFEIIIFGMIVLIVILIIINLITLIKLSNKFIIKKFKIRSLVDLNPTTKDRSFLLYVYNNNINDTRIVSIGIKYESQSIDFSNHYLQQNKLPIDQKININSRSFITLKLNILELKNIISDIKENKKLNKIEVYVIDSLGNQYNSKAKQIKKYLKKLYNEEKKELKNIKQIQIKLIKEEKKLIKKERKLTKQNKRIENWRKFKLKIKRMFKLKK